MLQTWIDQWINQIVLFFTDGVVTFEKVMTIINFVICAVIAVLYFPQNAYMILALFVKPRRYKKAEKLHNYGYLICAHDEEDVIGLLIDSIKKQNYPQEKMHIFVCADNCSDNTYKVALEHGAIAIERFDDTNRGKSYALDTLIHYVMENHKVKGCNGCQDDDAIEAFFLFDADNLLTADYTLQMNNLFDSGVKVATSFRNSKNFGDNHFSANASLGFLRECNFMHKCRDKLGIGTSVSGTGFYISSDILIAQDGWHYNLLVEDIEFSINCANQGIRIGYCHNAIFYDEQPLTLKDSMTQRLRWCKGTLQCFAKYWGKLLKRIFTKGTLGSVALFMHVVPLPVLSFIWMIIYCIAMGINCIVLQHPISQLMNVSIIPIIGFLLGLYFVALLQAVITFTLSRKQIMGNKKKLFWYCFTFPFYSFESLILQLKALFVKKVTWTKVPHVAATTIESVEALADEE